MSRDKNSGLVVKEGTGVSYKSFKTFSNKIAFLTFGKMMNFKSVDIQLDNQTALSYLLKMGGTKGQEFLRVSKEI